MASRGQHSTRYHRVTIQPAFWSWSKMKTIQYVQRSYFLQHQIKKYCLVTPLYLVEDLVDEIHIVPGGQQDGLHHVVDIAVLLLNATQTGITGPPIWQRAAVGVALLRLPRWPVCIPIWCLILLLAATACSDSLGTTETQWHMRVC